MALQTFPMPTGQTTQAAGQENLDGSDPLPVRQVGIHDIRVALEKGAEDFWAKPSHVVFLALIYPLAGLILARLIVGYDILPLLFPLAAGFALVGPFAAIGLYEISRRRELGLDTSWSHAFEVLHSPGFGSVLELGGILMAIFFIWLAAAWILYALTIGTDMPISIDAFVHTLFTTPAGWTLIIVGNAVGFLFALGALTISVVSFPLILDRHVGAVAAMRTSIAAVRKNPLVMVLWGLVVAASLIVGLLPLFVGLALVLPILGHSTWHLYRRVVE
jgi:uncharacterized membrane protein